MNSHERKPDPDRTLMWLLAALLFLRLAMVIAYPAIARFMPAWQWSNNDGYDRIAVNWVTTGTFALEAGTPTAARLPLYPALIALCRLAAGTAFPTLVMLVQAVLSTLTGYALFRMTEGLFGRRPAVVAFLLFMFHPQANNFVFRCATETLFVFLVMMLLHNAVLFVRGNRRVDLLLAAAWLGLSLLTRQTLAPLALLSVPPVLLWAVLSRRNLRRTLVSIGLTAVTVAVILAPWLARNYARSGRVPVLQTWIGQPLYQGVTVSQRLPEFLRREKTLTELDQDALAVIREQTRDFLQSSATEKRPVAREIEADRYARRVARQAMLEKPGTTAMRALRNLVLAPVLQMTWRSTAVLMLWNWPLLLVSLTGAAWCFRRRRNAFLEALPVTIVFLYLLTVHALTWPQARYVLPGLLSFSAFAGLCLEGRKGFGRRAQD
ncbi:MAG: glycosyltransferase family 39 protein [Lentisphaerae bacterium]|nr:glycosyltransferase family 39 protein [Lentisphaerota bacterium]